MQQEKLNLLYFTGPRERYSNGAGHPISWELISTSTQKPTLFLHCKLLIKGSGRQSFVSKISYAGNAYFKSGYKSCLLHSLIFWVRTVICNWRLSVQCSDHVQCPSLSPSLWHDSLTHVPLSVPHCDMTHWPMSLPPHSPVNICHNWSLSQGNPASDSPPYIETNQAILHIIPGSHHGISALCHLVMFDQVSQRQFKEKDNTDLLCRWTPFWRQKMDLFILFCHQTYYIIWYDKHIKFNI